MPPRTVDPTEELAAFLRTRRERLDPDTLGLPSRRRTRRTPGLRREEVAELAGISTDYVVRLEQARGPRPSAEVVEALSQALRLPPDERAYLYDLTRQRPQDTARQPTAAAPPLAGLVEDLSPLPAMVMNHRFDILAWNREMSKLLLDFDTLPRPRRNAMWLCLTYLKSHDFYTDPDRILREGIAHLRTAWAAHPEDQALADLIAGFRATDEDFARLWSERAVKVNGRGHKRMRHPGIGTVSVQFETLAPQQDPDQLLVVYRPADEESRAALRQLSAR
ncbi:transcriptional regulator with XRE-family HTH domain [Crossiella equi]|uniref:Transcriptional regulator with XRE-family HTH domain n=1 Tax=Crossiella equi TaxID=130796 RepID=A0ABS5ASR4_9PSEU|nr:helix-turn-helix transcriptional regulator [Crossiella equi]MBP2479466.1 transcriptional regulator with XRE-family HTH domain [Crossiella equi]